MKQKANVFALVTLLCLFPVFVSAQTDAFGIPDTLYADLSKIDDYNWKVDISYTNDEWVDGLTIPLQLIGGKTRLRGDSAVYTGGRVEKFDLKGFRADTAIQCVTMGLMANLGPNKNTLPPGKGRLVTLFVSSPDKKPITEFTVDTTTTRPNNSLLIIAKRIQPGEPPDTLGYDREAEKQIIPVWVVRKSD